jgi:hypothetical protein
VEAEWHTLGERDSGDFAASEVLGVEHAEIARVGGGVVRDGKEPAGVFRGALGLRYEYRLCPAAAWAVLVCLDVPGFEVGLQCGAMRLASSAGRTSDV